jgi:chemotaxis protein MotB
MSGKGNKGDRRSVVIRKEEVVEGGHHGGAWKVAYADFVTAMMAFFLLMWLLNATTEAQRKGLADYFTPSNALSRASSGSGQPFGGHTPFDDGAMVSDRGAQAIQQGKIPVAPPDDPVVDAVQAQPRSAQAPMADGSEGQTDQDADASGNAETEQVQAGAKAPGGGQAAAQAQTPANAPAKFLANTEAGRQGSAAKPDDAAVKAELDRREHAAFEQAAEQIREAVRNDPQLGDLLKQVSIDQTPQGLRIQLLDADRQPMFALGSATPNDRARLLLQKIGSVLTKLPEPIALAGHTDAAPYKGVGMSNWELSAERANATRRLLVDAGVQDSRFRSVTGNADRDPLLPADPLAAANRRIAIVVLRAAAAGS